nr:carbohydrate ABC transporter permease [Marinicella sp. W31]MDC2878740.1 carbohydrate ABC transporter permease [Marinicella sp. W31]
MALVFLLPLLFMVMSSLKPDAQLLRDTSSLRAFLPVGDISLENYAGAFERAPIGLFVFNSVMITTITVLASLFLCSLGAFSFTFVRWRGNTLVLSIVLATLIIPFETIAIPLLLFVSRLPWLGLDGLSWGWLNTYRVQIIPWIADALTVFLFVQYFKDLPGELIEAARAEGASWWQVYRRVVMPLSGPVIATAAILKALKMYNEQYLWPLIVVQDEAHRPIMVGLGYFSSSTCPGAK